MHRDAGAAGQEARFSSPLEGSVHDYNKFLEGYERFGVRARRPLEGKAEVG